LVRRGRGCLLTGRPLGGTPVEGLALYLTSAGCAMPNTQWRRSNDELAETHGQ
jgi:hypothetical protein